MLYITFTFYCIDSNRKFMIGPQDHKRARKERFLGLSGRIHQNRE